MDASEKLVESYLKGIFSDVRYEPDGNVPPDFLADNRVAVEVRRLNQNHDDGGGKGPRGLEETAIPILCRVRDYLTGLGPARASGQSWYVSYRFGRPMPAWKELERELDSILVPFMAKNNPQPFEKRLNLTSEFSIKVFRASGAKPTFFRLSDYSDQQSGGWVISELETNLQHCIKDKTTKIQKYRHRYDEWWLVLPDHISFALDDLEREFFVDQVALHLGGFDKVILLDPRDAKRAFQFLP